jgi:hypothetical protein
VTAPRALSFAPRLLPAPEAAHYLGVSESTLAKLGIARRMLRGKRLYDRIDLDAYASDLPKESESEDNPLDAMFGAHP